MTAREFWGPIPTLESIAQLRMQTFQTNSFNWQHVIFSLCTINKTSNQDYCAQYTSTFISVFINPKMCLGGISTSFLPLCLYLSEKQETKFTTQRDQDVRNDIWMVPQWESPQGLPGTALFLFASVTPFTVEGHTRLTS